MRRLAAAVLLLTSAACGSGERPPIPAGFYQLVRINEKPLPVEAPTEPGVTVVDGGLSLQSDANYTLRLDAKLASQPGPQSRTITGRYVMTRDTLALSPVQGSPAGPIRYQFAVDGEELLLRDGVGNRYAFTKK